MKMAQAVETRPVATQNIWINRTFLSVLTGNTLSALGDGLHTVALGIWALQHTGSAAIMSYIFAARILASIVVGPFAGTLSDRVDRRRLMIATDLIRVVLVALLIGAIHLSINAWVLVGLSFIISASGTFFRPAFNASLIQIVGKEDINRATSLLRLTTTISEVSGPALGGIIVALVGARAALAVDAGTFLVSALAVAAVQFASPRSTAQAQQSSFWTDMKEGIAYMRGHRLVRVVLMFSFISFFGAGQFILLPTIAVRVWKASGFEFGLIEASWPLGLSLAAMALAWFSRRIKRRGLLLVSTLVAAGLLDMITPLVPNAYAAVPLLITSSVLAGVAMITTQILVQTTVQPEMLGRVFGIYGSLANAAWPLGVLAAGFLGDRFSPVPLAIGFAAGFVLVALQSLSDRSVRQFE